MHGWLGWTIGIATAIGVVVFEFRRWWDYILTGKRELPEAQPPRLSGSERFREPGTTVVRLLSSGDRPDLVVRRLRAMTELDEREIADLVARVPTDLPATLSLRSADLVVDGLRRAGADCQLVIPGVLAPRPTLEAD